MCNSCYKTIGLNSKWFFLLTAILIFSSCKERQEETANEPVLSISKDNEGITVPDGFGVIKVADSLGAPRHIAVNSNGGVYLKLRKPIDGEGIIYLEDHDGDGIADAKKGFADYGGTGIYLGKKYLYASSDEEIFRYKLNSEGLVVDPGKPDTLVTKLVAGRTHATKSFTLDTAGYIYVNIGAYSNA
ncbi:MAG: sorbosone dehydrogenase, partial [Eudoraea sp.]